MVAEARKILGQRIKEARLKRKLSQEDLAELAEVHVSYIGQVERGEKSPSVPVLSRLSKALEVPLSQILEHSELREAKVAYKVKPRWKQLVKLSEGLDDKTLDFVLKFIRLLKKQKNL